MPDDVWILGASMVKFGRYPDQDLMDIGSEAAMGALADAGASMADIDILAVGNQLEPVAGVGQRLQKQIGQTGIPVYNVTNACATGASAIRVVSMAIKAGEAEMGLAVGVEKMAKAGIPGGGGAQPEKVVYERQGRTGAVMSVEGVLGT
ncbi:MAG TPA: beta-ketoacyl synthase N-terminal-like domain-containing protein, partial [Acidimicrobiales bacterium]